MSDELPSIASLRALDVLSELDVHFADAMLRLSGERDPRVGLAAAIVSRQVQNGHVCLELDRLCRGELALDANSGPLALAWPACDQWLAALRESPLVGDAQATTPLCLGDGARLYLRRYFEHERSLLHALRERASAQAPDVDRSVLQAGLDRWFAPQPPKAEGQRAATTRRRTAQLDLFAEAPADLESNAAAGVEPHAPDLQRRAAERALTRALCVISGGPGTGKTATVVKILALLVDQARAHGRNPPRVHLLAPTGKAAARLSEAIARAKTDMTPELRAAIPEDASTIHRALGTRVFGSQRFAHDRETPLATDVVVVDEASMVDLSLMTRLFDAVPRHARVILLGDQNQLASVEAGAVLGDICGTGRVDGVTAKTPPIADCIVQLTRSYRYAENSGIRRLADAINAADAPRALELLRDPALPDISLVDTTGDDALPRALLAATMQALAPFLAATTAQDKLRALDAFRVLCAHRRGSHGQVAVNAAIEAELRARRSISGHAERYAGRPILITQNDPHARLFNGDVGVLLADADDVERVRAHFASPSAGERDVALARLPPHESVYAMSVHKSQGSEFDEVAVLLPPEASPVLSRELLYTAVTRARKRVVVYASQAVFTHAVSRAVQRSSGLWQALWAD